MFKFIDFFNSATLKTSYNYYFPEFTLLSCEIIFLMYLGMLSAIETQHN